MIATAMSATNNSATARGRNPAAMSMLAAWRDGALLMARRKRLRAFSAQIKA
jgi:hypothetical protein